MMTDEITPPETEQRPPLSKSSEKNLAMLAHGSILLTFLAGISTGGLGAVVAAFLPLVLWFFYRDRSRFVAFHAMQATLFQLAVLGGTLVAAIVVALVLLVVWLVTGILSIILIGLLLIPVALLLTIALGLLLPLIPIAAVGYGLFGVWEISNDREFRYEWLADWLTKRNRGQLFLQEG
ncbi:MAG: DUF4870 domain-containing protein [Anaerolineae bacterium]